MDELSLIVEGIINKINRLKVRNEDLKEEIAGLKKQNDELNRELKQQISLNKQIKEELNQVKVAKMLNPGDSFQASAKVNELLRDIEKCYSLLNR